MECKHPNVCYRTFGFRPFGFWMILCLISFRTQVQSQVAVFQQSFNACTGAPPAGWTTTVLSGSVDWSFDSIGVQTSSIVFPLDSCGAYFNDDAAGPLSFNNSAQLTSPVINLLPFNTATLQFYFANETNGANSYLAAEVFDGLGWVEIFRASSDSFGVANIDISPFLISNFQFRFVFDDDGSDAFGAAVDQISVNTTIPFDAAVQVIPAYFAIPSAQQPTTLSAIARNVGSDTVTNVVITIQVLDALQNVVSNASSINFPFLAPGDSLPFNTLFQAPALGNYTVRAFVQITETDNNALNDTASYSIVITPQEYARDNGILNNTVFGANNNYLIAQQFDVVQTSILNSLSVVLGSPFINSFPQINSTFRLELWSASGNIPGSPVLTTNSFTVTTPNTQQTVVLPPLSGPTSIPSGSYFVVLRDQSPLGVVNQIARSNNYYTPGVNFFSENNAASWIAYENLNTPIFAAPALRMQLGCVTVDAGFDTTVCVNDSITLGGFPSGSAVNLPASYSWTPTTGLDDPTAANPRALITGDIQYILTVSDSSGCSLSDTVNITTFPVPLVELFIPQREFCLEDSSVVLTGTPFGGIYSGPGMVQDTFFPFLAGPGIHRLVYAYTDTNLCITRASVLATVIKPIAAFETSPACLGRVIVFDNQTTVANDSIIQYLWNLGDAGTSTVKNPVASYNIAQNYVVRLEVVSSLGCRDTLLQNVLVTPDPIAAFSANPVCEGDTVAFLNTSNIASGTLSYLWDFGDGSSSTAIQPSHFFTNPGSYQVRLIAVNANQCADTTFQTVVVNPKPQAAFTANPTCTGLDIGIVNQSQVAFGPITYQWDFGDGTNSQNIEPSKQYLIPGFYTIRLIARSDLLCSDTATLAIQQFTKPNASFTVQNVCQTDSAFFFSSVLGSGGNVYAWDLGDGTLSTVVNPIHRYANPGTFNVNLFVTSVDNCADTAVGQVIIHPQPIAAFTISSVCEGQLSPVVNTSSIAYGSMNYLWNWGDGTQSQGIQPIKQYASAGRFGITLTASSDQNCISTFSDSVSIFEKPSVDFSAASVCFGQTVQLVQQSIIPTGSQITVNWGDGTLNNLLSHLYSAPGSYLIEMNIASPDQCTDTASITVSVFALPQPNFLTQNVCLGEPNVFVNQSGSNQGSLQFFWNFGNGAASTDISPVYVYDSSAIYTVQLSALTNDGCSDSISQTLIVYPQPIPDFSLPVICVERPVQINNLSSILFGSMSYEWDFGNGSTSIDSTPSFIFPALGVYNISLTVTSDAGCQQSITKQRVSYPNPQPAFTLQSACERNQIFIQDLSHIESGSFSHLWQFGNGDSTIAAEPIYAYPSAGTYQVRLVLTSDQGCISSTERTLTVHPTPDAQFTFQGICIGEPTQFTNQTLFNQGLIDEYRWSFGDGRVSFEDNPTNLYANTGAYTVRLIAISDQACRDTISQSIIIRPLPEARIRALGPNAFCDGDTLSLIAGTGFDNYLWSTSETTSLIDVFLEGLYSVTATSSFGCQNFDSLFITVYPLPTADAGLDTTLSKGFSLYLNGSGGVFYNWSPPERLSDPTIFNPEANPLQTTDYILTVRDNNGCIDTDTVTVFVAEDYRFIFTNLFTPNQDGVNDTWEIINIETYPNCEVLIFDRWGTQVYEKKTYLNEWDGTYKGNALPDGTYYYVVRFDGVDRLFKGTVSILR